MRAKTRAKTDAKTDATRNAPSARDLLWLRLVAQGSLLLPLSHPTAKAHEPTALQSAKSSSVRGAAVGQQDVVYHRPEELQPRGWTRPGCAERLEPVLRGGGLAAALPFAAFCRRARTRFRSLKLRLGAFHRTSQLRRHARFRFGRHGCRCAPRAGDDTLWPRRLGRLLCAPQTGAPNWCPKLLHRRRTGSLALQRWLAPANPARHVRCVPSWERSACWP